jgi:hypothetical protein
VSPWPFTRRAGKSSVGKPLDGEYSLSNSIISATIVDTERSFGGRPEPFELQVVVRGKGSPTVETEVAIPTAAPEVVRGLPAYRFQLSLDGVCTPRQLALEHKELWIRHETGARGQLRMSSSSQTMLLREHTRPERETIAFIDFSARGNARSFMGEGWAAKSDQQFTWGLGPRSTLIVPLPSEIREVVMCELAAVPFLFLPFLQEQRLNLLLDGKPIFGCIFDRPTLEQRVTRLPRELLVGRDRVVLTFEHPDHRSPATLQGSTDDRQLSLGFALVLVTHEPFTR